MDYAAEILAISKAIASGALRVTYDDGKSVEYDNFDNMLARLRWLKNQQSGTTSGGSSFVTFDRDE